MIDKMKGYGRRRRRRLSGRRVRRLRGKGLGLMTAARVGLGLASKLLLIGDVIGLAKNIPIVGDVIKMVGLGRKRRLLRRRPLQKFRKR